MEPVIIPLFPLSQFPAGPAQEGKRLRRRFLFRPMVPDPQILRAFAPLTPERSALAEHLSEGADQFLPLPVGIIPFRHFSHLQVALPHWPGSWSVAGSIQGNGVVAEHLS